jgi:hypothetical protein
MSRARKAVYLFTDSKAALREAVVKPSSRLSPMEIITAAIHGASRNGGGRTERFPQQTRQTKHKDREPGMER